MSHMTRNFILWSSKWSNRVVDQGSAFVSLVADSQCFPLLYHTSPLSLPSLSSWIRNQGKVIGSSRARTGWSQLAQLPKTHTTVVLPHLSSVIRFVGYFTKITRSCTDEHVKILWKGSYPLGVVLDSTSRREAKRWQSTNRKGEMSRASHK